MPIPLPNINDQFMTRPGYLDGVNAQWGYLLGEHSYFGPMPACESLAESAELKARQTIDWFMRGVTTFTTNVLDCTKSIKRGELRKYSQDHLLAIKQLESTSYERWEDLEIFIPTGLVKTFGEGVRTLMQYYERVDVNSLLNNYINTVYALTVAAKHQQLALLNGSQTVDLPRRARELPQLLAQQQLLTTKMAGQLSTLASEQQAVFTADNTPERVPFKRGYKSMADLKQVRQSLLALEPMLNLAFTLNSNLQQLDRKLGELDAVIGKQGAEQSLPAGFADGLGTLARSLDLYGLTVQRQLTLEHNHCLNLQLLAKSL